jgi:hypothetical protein
MKACLERNNLHNFTFSPYSEKPVKAVIHHLPPDTPAEDISNSLEDIGLNVINVRQMTATRRAPNAQTHVEFLHPFFVTLTRNIKSREIFKQSSLNHIHSSKWPSAKTFAMSGPALSNSLDVCGGVVADCIGNALKRQIQNLR